MTSAEIYRSCLPGNVPFHSPSLHGHTVTQPSAQYVHLLHFLEKCQHLLELSVIPKISLWWHGSTQGFTKKPPLHIWLLTAHWAGAQDSSSGSWCLQVTTALWTQLCSHSQDPSVSLGVKMPKGGSGLQGWHLRVWRVHGLWDHLSAKLSGIWDPSTDPQLSPSTYSSSSSHRTFWVGRESTRIIQPNSYVNGPCRDQTLASLALLSNQLS